MNDLYSLVGLTRFEEDAETIRRALGACIVARDRDLAASILCDKSKKQVYDKALKAVLLAKERTRQVSDDPAEPAAESSAGEQGAPGLPRCHCPVLSRSGQKLLGLYGIVAAGLFVIAGWLASQDNSGRNAAINPALPSAEWASEVDIVEITRKRYHVTAERLNVRARPDRRSRIIGQLNQYDDLMVEFPEAGDGWVRIDTNDGLEGYVAIDFVAPGDGGVALRNDCAESVIRPPSGRLVQTAVNGFQHLAVEAPPEYDVVVRLVDLNGDTALLGYVRAGQVYSFDGVPAGHYQLDVGAGKTFSEQCGFFEKAMMAALFSRPLVLEPAGSKSPDAHFRVSLRLSRAANSEI